MTQIDMTSSIAAMLRRHMNELRRSNEKAGKPNAGKASLADSPSTAGSRAALGSQLPEIYARRVLEIPADDNQRDRKAFRIFLESILLAEFGVKFVDDMSFQLLVDRVQEQMELDPDLSVSIHEAAILMLTGGTGSLPHRTR